MPFRLHGSENMPITAYLQIKKNSKKKEKAFIKAHSYQKKCQHASHRRQELCLPSGKETFRLMWEGIPQGLWEDEGLIAKSKSTCSPL